MKPQQVIFLVIIAITLSACATRTVRKQDLDSWVGVPVEALDMHSFFITLPMNRTVTESGIEIRNYADDFEVTSCFGTPGANPWGNYISANAFYNCTNNRIVCNNIFYIKDGIVIEYAPTGSCYTDETVQPEPRYLRLKGE